MEEQARPTWRARARNFARRNAYLGLAIAAGLILTRAIDFTPPPQVRMHQADVTQVVGDAPPQDFSPELGNPQAVQIRATLRLYPDAELEVSAPDPETDELGKLLSQPVVTTILGMNATVEQTVRLEGDRLEADVSLSATPRLRHEARAGKPPPPLALEYELVVRSRKRQWWRDGPVDRVHLDTRGFLDRVEDHGHRVVFTVDGHLLSIDLELHRPAIVSGTLAASR